MCVPSRKVWDLSVPAKCLDVLTLMKFGNTFCGLRTACNLVIYSLPIRYLWKLQMEKWKRVQLIGLFGMGGLACACSVALLVLQVRTKDVLKWTGGSCK